MDLQIRENREQRNLTKEDLAEISGVPLEIVRDIEIGICDVSGEDIRRITTFLSCGIGG